MFQPVFLPTSVLFAGALLEIVLAGVLSRAAKGWLAFLASALALAAVFALMPAIIHGEVLTATLFDWDASIALVYHVDGLSVLFMLLGAGMGSAILLYSVGYMEEEEEGVTRFYVLMLVFIAGFVMLACSANLLIIYFAWELIGLCSYFLVGFWYKQQVAADGARKVLIITHIAGYGLLAAIILLYVRTGTFVWTDPAVAAAFSGVVVLMMIVAAMAKSVMYPLHTWIPEAMNAPTPVSALLHSACYVKAGAYLIARMYSIGPWHETFGNLLLVIGCVTMLVGVIFALAQTDLKRLLAFHTVSQLGYVVTGLALGTSLGVTAGLFYAASHALFKGTLFMCAGAVQRATGTRDMRKLGGLAARMPVTTLVWLVSAAAIAGVPLTNGFVAKWLLFDAALEAKQAVVVVVAWAVSVLTAFSFLKATVGVFYGIPGHELHVGEIHEVSHSMRVGMGITGALCVVFGFAPQLLMQPVIEPAVRSMGFDWQIQVTWLGIVTGSGTIGVTIGAVAGLALATAFGAGAYRLVRAPAGGRPVSVFSGGEPLPDDDTLGVVDFAEMAEAAFGPIYSLNPDPLYFRIWGEIRDGAAGARRFMTTKVERAPVLTAVVCAAVLLAAVALP
ncbi:MAG: NADH-quinone oxidoreductase subunit L [Roseiarcus sp.]|jgi:multicomponent Na+:H+ antiporter subunit A